MLYSCFPEQPDKVFDKKNDKSLKTGSVNSRIFCFFTYVFTVTF